MGNTTYSPKSPQFYKKSTLAHMVHEHCHFRKHLRFYTILLELIQGASPLWVLFDTDLS